MLQERPVGICPACGESVFNSREPDGPVWTCPSDLSPDNPYYEELPDDYQTTEEEKERSGYFANCPDQRPGGGACPFAWSVGAPACHMPLHSACYDKGEY